MAGVIDINNEVFDKAKSIVVDSATKVDNVAKKLNSIFDNLNKDVRKKVNSFDSAMQGIKDVGVGFGEISDKIEKCIAMYTDAELNSNYSLQSLIDEIGFDQFMLLVNGGSITTENLSDGTIYDYRNDWAALKDILAKYKAILSTMENDYKINYTENSFTFTLSELGLTESEFTNNLGFEDGKCTITYANLDVVLSHLNVLLSTNSQASYYEPGTDNYEMLEPELQILEKQEYEARLKRVKELKAVIAYVEKKQAEQTAANIEIIKYKSQIYNFERQVELFPFTSVQRNKDFSSYLQKDYSNYQGRTEGNLKFLSSEEMAIYAYSLEKNGQTAADNYLTAMQDTINQRKGAAAAWSYVDWVLTDDTVIGEDFLKTTFEGGKDGVINFGAGIGNFFNPDGIKSDAEYKQMYIAMALSQNIDMTVIKQQFKDGQIDETSYNRYLKLSQMNEVYRKALGKDYELSMSIGNMLPSVIVSSIPGCQTVGLALMGLSAAGNATEQAYQMGVTGPRAYFYGSIIGISEATLEKLLGNIPGLSNVAEMSLKGLLKEGLEEAVQTNVEHFLSAGLLGTDIDLKQLAGDSLKSFVDGVLISAIMNGGHKAVVVGGKTILSLDPKNMLKYVKKNGDTIQSIDYEAFKKDMLSAADSSGSRLSVDVTKDGITAIGNELASFDKVASPELDSDVPVVDDAYLADLDKEMTELDARIEQDFSKPKTGVVETDSKDAPVINDAYLEDINRTMDELSDRIEKDFGKPKVEKVQSASAPNPHLHVATDADLSTNTPSKVSVDNPYLKTAGTEELTLGSPEVVVDDAQLADINKTMDELSERIEQDFGTPKVEKVQSHSTPDSHLHVATDADFSTSVPSSVTIDNPYLKTAGTEELTLGSPEVVVDDAQLAEINKTMDELSERIEQDFGTPKVEKIPSTSAPDSHLHVATDADFSTSVPSSVIIDNPYLKTVGTEELTLGSPEVVVDDAQLAEINKTIDEFSDRIEQDFGTPKAEVQNSDVIEIRRKELISKYNTPDFNAESFLDKLASIGIKMDNPNIELMLKAKNIRNSIEALANIGAIDSAVLLISYMSTMSGKFFGSLSESTRKMYSDYFKSGSSTEGSEVIVDDTKPTGVPESHLHVATDADFSTSVPSSVTIDNPYLKTAGTEELTSNNSDVVIDLSSNIELYEPIFIDPETLPTEHSYDTSHIKDGLIIKYGSSSFDAASFIELLEKHGITVDNPNISLMMESMSLFGAVRKLVDAGALSDAVLIMDSMEQKLFMLLDSDLKKIYFDFCSDPATNLLENPKHINVFSNENTKPIKNFNNYSEFISEYKAQSDLWVKSLSSEMLNAVHAYIGENQYRSYLTVNGYLRGTLIAENGDIVLHRKSHTTRYTPKEWYDAYKETVEELLLRTQKDVELLSTTLSMHFKEKTILYRGVSNLWVYNFIGRLPVGQNLNTFLANNNVSLLEYLRLQIGNTYTEKSFMSVTPDKEISFVKYAQIVIELIANEKNTFGHYGVYNSGEAELVLSIGQQFQITDVSQNSDGKIVVRMEAK